MTSGGVTDDESFWGFTGSEFKTKKKENSQNLPG